MKGFCSLLMCILGISLPVEYPLHAERRVGGILCAADARNVHRPLRLSDFQTGEWVAVQEKRNEALRYACIKSKRKPDDEYAIVAMMNHGHVDDRTISCQFLKKISA